MPPATIGERLKHARDRAFLTQEELAERSGVPVVTISRIENNRVASTPRKGTIKTLALALGVTPQWLMFGDEMEKAAA